MLYVIYNLSFQKSYKFSKITYFKVPNFKNTYHFKIHVCRSAYMYFEVIGIVFTIILFPIVILHTWIESHDLIVSKVSVWWKWSKLSPGDGSAIEQHRPMDDETGSDSDDYSGDVMIGFLSHHTMVAMMCLCISLSVVSLFVCFIVDCGKIRRRNAIRETGSDRYVETEMSANGGQEKTENSINGEELWWTVLRHLSETLSATDNKTQ